MSELVKRVRVLGERLAAGYDPQGSEAALDRLRRGLRRRRRRRVVASLAVVLLLGAGSLWLLRPSEVAQRLGGERPPVLFSLSDGSTVERLDGAGQVEARSVTANLVELDLRAGGARFDVTPNPQRRFRVLAGGVSVEVLGTRFTVARHAEQAQVEVQRGRVRVEWERGQQILEPGERGTFPPVAPSATGAVSPAELPAVPSSPAEDDVAAGHLAPPAVVPAPKPARRGPSPGGDGDWRALARRGAFTEAYRITNEKVAPDSLGALDDLLLAADVARSSGHARMAVPYLERALALHRGDERAAVAAFTLGRVLQGDPSEGRRAAAAFARARLLSPNGPLAEDALAREVETWAANGEPSRARELAEEYVRRWPQGRRLREVRHFGGLP